MLDEEELLMVEGADNIRNAGGGESATANVDVCPAVPLETPRISIFPLNPTPSAFTGDRKDGLGAIGLLPKMELGSHHLSQKPDALVELVRIRGGGSE